MNVLSVFDGMSCGHLALDKAGVKVDNYVASEVKDFAINHTKDRYKNTIQVGDVTKLHYENGKLYKNCSRWAIIKDIRKMSLEDYNKNGHLIRYDGDHMVVDLVNLSFSRDFDKNNKILADYKDNDLFVLVSNIPSDRIEELREEGFTILPNGEIVKWGLGEVAFEGEFDLFIGGSPCQNFSAASYGNDEKYGLEGSKSRLFFDFLRLKNETNVPYYFLENVQMKADSKKALDDYMGVSGIRVNSNKFSIQNRDRFYWTNIVSESNFEIPKIDEKSIDFQNYKVLTTSEAENFIFEKCKKPFGSMRKKGEFEAVVNELDSLLSDEDIYLIARILNPCYYEEFKNTYGNASERDFVKELHLQLCETQTQISRSRDEMFIGGYDVVTGTGDWSEGYDENGLYSYSGEYVFKDGEKVFVPATCKNISDESKMSCQMRKQDRRNSCGIVSFGCQESIEYVDENGNKVVSTRASRSSNPFEALKLKERDYYRFLTRFELCKGQTIPFSFVSDLSLLEIEDVCGDGWTVDVIARFFEYLPNAHEVNSSYKYENPNKEYSFGEVYSHVPARERKEEKKAIEKKSFDAKETKEVKVEKMVEEKASKLSGKSTLFVAPIEASEEIEKVIKKYESKDKRGDIAQVLSNFGICDFESLVEVLNDYISNKVVAKFGDSMSRILEAYKSGDKEAKWYVENNFF